MRAYFIFQKTMSSLDDERRIYTELETTITTMAGDRTWGHGQVQNDDEIWSQVSNLNIRFYGDLVLPHSPSTFEEAVEVYRQLPEFVVGENAHSVPMRVHLAPVSSLDPFGVFAIIQDIGQSLISDVTDILQEIENAKEEIQYLSQSTADNYFRFVTIKIDRFQNFLRQYQQNFQGHIGPLIVAIRGSGREEGELASYLQQHFNSPFSKFSLETWVEQVKEECSVLESFIDLLSHITFCQNHGEFIHQVLTNERVISLNMYFPERTDIVLENMNNFLDGHNYSNSANNDFWFRHWTTALHFQRYIHYLISYKEANLEGPSIAYVFQALTPQNRSIQWPYIEIQGIKREYGHTHEELFIPPGPPTSIWEIIQNDSVTVHWEPPTLGSDFIEHYAIVVHQRGTANPDDTIAYRYQTESTETEFQISTPDSSTPYDVYVYGVCRIGRTASSEILHHSGVQVRLVGGAEICSPRRAYYGRVEVSTCNICGQIFFN